MNCVCCLIKSLANSLKNLSVTITNPSTCDIPQPLEISGTVETNISFPDSINTLTTISNNPLEITGTILTQQSDQCSEAMIEILSSSKTFQTIVFKNGDKFQSVTDLTVDGYKVSFNNQKQNIQTTVCNIEYIIT